jgi:ketosteroid isomerase-like protein
MAHRGTIGSTPASLNTPGSRHYVGDLRCARTFAVLPIGRSVGVRGYSWQMDTREAAQRWAEVWERGWREHDAPAIAALYAEDAFWQQHPFREPEPGYLARVFAEEESAQCQFGTPIVDGDQAAVPWSAQTRLKDGGTENLAGVSVLRFRADGLVAEERDFTHG